MEEKNWYDGVLAPFDADGSVVPLTTRKLYRGDGREVEIGEVSLVSPELNGDWVWCVRTPDGAALVLNILHVERPDSLERLADDLARYDEHKVTCEYFGMTVAGGTCDGCWAHDCRAHGRRCSCIALVLDDVARRVAALREAE
ncbi:hypothetical protein ACTQ1Z_03470 [Parolsenella sp. LCP21S3_E11]|uniref:hypothetical protein n=1 Tax=Parolsenella sp. LCP21S3_E11 TaxID=3438797 RepID=UPI003F9B4C08